MSYSSAIPQISSEEIATQDYLRALAAFNAVLRADPICRQLDSGKKAWGDIMYEDDERNAATAPGISIFDKMVAQQAALPVPVVQEFRSFPAPSPRMQQRQPQQRQPQQLQQRQQVPVQQQKPVQKPSQQKKRARNAFADLDEDSE
jgi:hypothetical protein